MDRDDLDKLIEFDRPWSLYNLNGLHYARASIYERNEEGKSKLTQVIFLHRWIMGATDGHKTHVDHIDHDGLNNRKYNLRVVTAVENAINRKGKNKNNKSGYRNVFWSNSDQRWVVSLCINGKRIHGGNFRNVDEAGQVAASLREKYYGELGLNS